MSLAILVSDTATTFSARRAPPGRRGSPAPRRVKRLGDLEARVLAQLGAHPLGELGVRVQARAGGGAAERDLSDPAQRAPHPVHAQLHLGRVAAEFLAQGHRDRVHQVGAAGLDDVGELLGLALQRRGEPVHRGQQVVGHLDPGPPGGRPRGRRRSTTGPCSRRRSGGHRPRRGWRSPRWHSCSRRCRSRSGRRRSGTGRRARRRRPPSPAAAMRSANSRSSRPSSAFTSAAAALMRPSQRTTGHRDRLARDGEVGHRLPRLLAPELGLNVGRSHSSSAEPLSAFLTRSVSLPERALEGRPRVPEPGLKRAAASRRRTRSARCPDACDAPS